ncbi:reverse transcriptase [Brachionus plicatilis]|uniref:Reverse transcriptase n=1 Tax=Brachionus plicatilis TaxID=10195 RepID=A0A3M7RHD8_BRAPC|nr:reverse transcriptase [Brachionus plicatilis]
MAKTDNDNEEDMDQEQGTNLLQYSDPIKLKQEIDKYLKDVTIEKAFINRYTGQLCIITSDEASITKITSFTWPKKAFGAQITPTTNKKKIYYMAIHGIHASTDVDSLKIENCILKRIFKKSTKQPTNTIQITTDDESTYSRLLKEGKYKFGYSSVRISPWTFDPKPVQCHNCSKIGHTQMTCCDTKPTCPICTGEHTLQNCQYKDDKSKHKCINCKENHPAFSKSCLFMQVPNKQQQHHKPQHIQLHQTPAPRLNNSNYPAINRQNASTSQVAHQPSNNNHYNDVQQPSITTHNQTFNQYGNTLQHYNFIRNDRSYSNGGGIGVLIKKKFKFKLLHQSNNYNEEVLAISIYNPTINNNLVLIGAYTHPKSRSTFDFVSKLMSNHKYAILLGDLNAHHISWYNKKTNK